MPPHRPVHVGLRLRHCPRPLSGRGQSPARSEALWRSAHLVDRQRSGDNPGRNDRGRVPDASEVHAEKCDPGAARYDLGTEKRDLRDTAPAARDLARGGRAILLKCTRDLGRRNNRSGPPYIFGMAGPAILIAPGLGGRLPFSLAKFNDIQYQV
eukprot:gene10927-biopygen22848